MLRWALGFFIVALVAALLGFGGIAATAAGIAKIIFYLFLILFLLALLGHLVRRNQETGPSEEGRASGPINGCGEILRAFNAGRDRVMYIRDKRGRLQPIFLALTLAFLWLIWTPFSLGAPEGKGL